MSSAVAPASRVGALLAGALIACWLVAGAVWLLPVARRASARASRPPPPRRRPRTRRRHRQGPGRLVLALFGLTAAALPLLLEGWSAWPWSVGNLALVGLGVGAARLGAKGSMLSQRLVMLAVLICLAGAGFVLYAVWGRLLLLGGVGTALAAGQAVLAAVLLLSVFAVSVLEAAAWTLAWCRRGSARRWLLAAGVCVLTLALPPLAGLPWWLGLPGIMLLAASIGLFRIGELEAGQGHVLSLLSGVTGGMYLLLVLITGALSWRRL